MTKQSQDRRERLRALLNSGEQLSYDDLQRELNLRSTRHAKRLLNELADGGKSVQSVWRDGRKLFYLREEDRELGIQVRFSEEQFFVLAVAAEAARAALQATPLGTPLEAAFATLLERLPADVYSFESDAVHQHWHFSNAPSVEIDPGIFRRLSRAISECRRIRIDYITAQTGRRSTGRLVEPYGLAVRGGTWLLVAWCRRRRDLRDFALAGITRVQEDGQHFLRPEGFNMEHYFRDRMNALAGDTLHTVRLLVEPDRAVYFQRKRYHHSQHIEERRTDGRVVVRFDIANLEDMRSFAQSWGIGVTALEPPELVERLREEAGVLAERYSP